MKMPQLTIEQRKLIVEEMILTKSTTSTRRKFKKLNGYSPSKRTIQQLFLKWRKECTLHNLNKGRSGHPVTHRNPVNINHVESLILENDTKSTRKLASETGLSRTTMQKILKKDLGLKSYTAKVTQQLSECDKTKRLEFCQRVKMMIESGDLNLNEIIFSDETHIHLNGSPNKQNCRKWSTSKPSFNFSVPLHSPRITVCLVWRELREILWTILL